MDSDLKKHNRMDDVLRNYYGSVHFGKRRRITDMEKVIRGYYAPSDRRAAVLRNYYGVGGDVIKHHYHRMHHVLGNYYGQMDLYREHEPAGAPEGEPAVGGSAAGSGGVIGAGGGTVVARGSSGMVVAKSFDDGEVLAQKGSGEKKDRDFEEYIVDKTFQADACEEYVVYSQSVEEGPCEEYVVYSQSDDDGKKDDAGPVDLDAYDKQVLKELNIDISNPLAPAKAASVRSMDVEELKAEEVEAVAAPVAAPTQPPEGSKEERDLLADIQSIMSTPAGGGGEQANAQATAEPPLPPNGHAIFDRIARSMQYANAYDLGTVELDNRFENFDKDYDAQQRRVAAPAQQQEPGKRQEAAQQQAAAGAVATSMDSDIPNPADFIKDLDSILKGDVAGQQPQGGFGGMGGGYGGGGFGGETFLSLSTPKPDDPAWPPKPANIRPYTSAERIAKFGEFSFEPDPGSYNGDGIRVLNGWDAQHIVMVDIPQLAALKHPRVQFHRQGATQLQELWKAWEDAGLLDRILSFDGSYATRFIRHTGDRNPRPVSNHAWGTAFDINAGDNGFGQVPVVVGKKGGVRELVELANQHGFYWGGHFSPHPDGMHFELGKLIS